MSAYTAAKRLVDICVSATALLIFALPMLFISLSIRKEMGSPIIFTQKRTGRNGRIFDIYKFRTMKDARDENGTPLSDGERLTKLGQKLRSASLDELPQLWNVLRGDMSLVGPRPLLPEYIPLYSPRQKKRLSVPQGITGWAQINGRNAISWPQKFELDVWYVENRGMLLDLKILALTIKKACAREGISAPNETTMPPFRGEK